jgi:hypothetical protein
MSDDEIEIRLREHGGAWREANHDRPGVDWDLVTRQRGRRGWLAAAGVAVVAVAIVVPLIVIGVGHNRARPATHPIVTIKGTPANFFAISKGQAWEVYFSSRTGPLSASSDSDGSLPVVALGVARGAQIAYAALDSARSCRTEIERHHLYYGGASLVGLPSILGRAASVPMAVSPDGTELALVVTLPTQSNASGRRESACVGPEALVVMNVITHKIREWTAPQRDAIRSLEWSPDGDQLAYLTAPACAFLSFSDSVCGDDKTAGTRLLDVAAPGKRLKTTALLLSAFGTRDGYGPLFWWHSQLVAPFNGSLRLVTGHRRLGQVVATGLPKEVDSISSDATGDHLLISSEGTTYRWDAGRLTVVKGNWTQPGW